MTAGISCPVCGELLPGPGPRRTGRKLSYCSGACKAKAYRARQRSGEHARDAGPQIPLTAAADRYARTIEIRQQIGDLTTALADTASGQQALFAAPRTARSIRPAAATAALHRLITELAALAATAASQTRRTRTGPATTTPQTPPLFSELKTGE